MDQSRIMVSTVERAPTLRASVPTLAHDLNALRLETNAWDIMPDGRLLALQLGVGEEQVQSVNIILNWLASARRKLGK